jgi:hypothetical protein
MAAMSEACGNRPPHLYSRTVSHAAACCIACVCETKAARCARPLSHRPRERGPGLRGPYSGLTSVFYNGGYETRGLSRLSTD